MPALPHPAANRLVQSAFLIGFAMRKALSITQSTCSNLLLINAIRYFFRIFLLLSRHAITLWNLTRYVVFSEYSYYSANTRNTIDKFDLWQIRNSDYAADMRKSISNKEMWPSTFSSRWARARARSHMLSTRSLIATVRRRG